MGRTGLYILIVGGIFVILVAFYLIIEFNGAKHWRTTKGQILSSGQQYFSGIRNYGAGGYGINTKYAYMVDGIRYISDKIAFFYTNNYSFNEADKILQKYQPNMEVVVYYDPKKPINAVLKPFDTYGIFQCFFAGGLMLLLGWVGMRLGKGK